MKYHVLTLLALVGMGMCAACSPYPTQQTCQQGLVRELLLESPDAFCATAVSNLQLAHDMLIESELVASEQEWRQHFGALTIWIGADLLLIPDQIWDSNLQGWYDDTRQSIQIDGSHDSLMHELLHRWQCEYKGLTSHDGWDSNGFNDLSDLYESQQLLANNIFQ